MRTTLQTLIAVTVMAAAGVAGAATVRQLSLKGMASLADVVVQAQVQSVDAQWLDGRIFRKVTLVAERVVKGAVKAGQPVVLWAPGGEVGDLGQWVPGAPEFEPGEAPLLFLEARPIGYVVVGMSVGKLRTERDDAGATWVVRDASAALRSAPLRVSWATLEATVRTAQ